MPFIVSDKDTNRRIIETLVSLFVEERKDTIKVDDYTIRFKRAGVIAYNTRTGRRSLVVITRFRDLARVSGLVSILWVEFLRVGEYRNITVCISVEGGITVQPAISEERVRELEAFLKQRL